MVDTKKEILGVLKRGKMATTKVALETKSSYWKTYSLLQELEKEGFIKRIDQQSQVMWELK